MNFFHAQIITMSLRIAGLTSFFCGCLDHVVVLLDVVLSRGVHSRGRAPEKPRHGDPHDAADHHHEAVDDLRKPSQRRRIALELFSAISALTSRVEEHGVDDALAHADDFHARDDVLLLALGEHLLQAVEGVLPDQELR